MFIRKRHHNKPLAGILLVVFLFASAFTQSSGTLALCIVKALGSSIDKSKQAKAAALQFPCAGTEKEGKKAEHTSVEMSVHTECLLADLRDRRVIIHYPQLKISDRTTKPLFLINKSLRL
jgi:hypothetical protein